MNKLASVGVLTACFATSITSAAGAYFISPAVCFEHRICTKNTAACWQLGVRKYHFEVGTLSKDETVQQLGLDYLAAAMEIEASKPHDSPNISIISAKDCFRASTTNDLSSLFQYPENEVLDDTDRIISKFFRAKRLSAIHQSILYRYVECDVAWNSKPCHHRVSLKAEAGWKVCNVVYHESHFSGSDPGYFIEPQTIDGAIPKEGDVVTSVRVTVTASGNLNSLNQIGARSKLSDVGLIVVLERTSPEDMEKLGCRPTSSISRVNGQTRGEPWSAKIPIYDFP